MGTVERWTGREVRVLRDALKMSVRDFATHTNLATSTITDIEAKGEHANLRRGTQRVLDEALATAPRPAQQRFHAATRATSHHDRERAGGDLTTIPEPPEVLTADGGGGSWDRAEVLRGMVGASVLPLIGALPLDPDDAEGTTGAEVSYGEVSQRLWQLYWSAPARPLFDAAYAHVRLGIDLLRGTSARDRSRLTRALGLSALLAARLAYFDLGRPGAADRCHAVALAAAREVRDHTMYAAVLGHMAFGPAFTGDSDQARALMTAAVNSAQHSSSLVRSWLHCVASEAEARAGNSVASLQATDQAEAELAKGEPAPEWFDFYDPVRMQCFAGYAALSARDYRLAADRLGRAFITLNAHGAKQRSVVAADLAATCEGDPDRAAHHLHEAADALEATWYGTGWNRIREARSLLGDSQLGRRLDERMTALAATGRA